jgi:putative transcriptional regulator
MKNNLKEERTIKQLTQSQLAEIVAVSRQTIISIESNRYVPSVLLALKLANALALNVEDLFELEPSDDSS